MRLNVHFHERVRVSVGVHGSQVSAADDAHDQTTLLTAVHERDQDPTPLLRVLAFIQLHMDTHRRHTHRVF